MILHRRLTGILVVPLLAAGPLHAAPAPAPQPDPEEQEAIAALRKLGAKINLYKDDPRQSACYLKCSDVKNLREALPHFRRLPRLQNLVLARTDAADDDLAATGDFDQRGPGYPRNVGGRIDIGAFEVQTANHPPALDPIADQIIPASQDVVTVTLSATDPDSDPLTFTAAAQSLAYVLSQQAGGFTYYGAYDDWGGRGEKWFLSGTSQWHFLLASGELYQWDGGPGASGTLVGNVGTSYHQDASRLVNPPADQPRATLSISGTTLTVTRDLSWVSALVVTVTVSDGQLSDSKAFTVTVAG